MFRVNRCLTFPRRVSSILVAAVALLAAVPAFASPIVYQHTAPAMLNSVRASQDQQPFGDVDFQVWDSFVLAGDTLIDGVDWQGSYLNTIAQNPALPPPANATGFVVQFYSDSLGAPGTLRASQTFTTAGANQNFNSNQTFSVFGASVYDYSTTLSSAFAAAGGTTYWLSVYALSPPATPAEAQWFWNGGLGGNGFAYQAGTAPTAPPPGQVNFDRALALRGNPAAIPEPATMLLFGTGLAGIAARARARRRNRK
jgi:hypothetical protein